MAQRLLLIAIISLLGIFQTQPALANDADKYNVSTKSLEYMSKAALFEYCDKAPSGHIDCGILESKLDALNAKIFFFKKGTHLQQALVIFSDGKAGLNASVTFSFNKDGFMEITSRGFDAPFAVEELVNHFMQFGYDE